jgi:hypothetical protein
VRRECGGAQSRLRRGLLVEVVVGVGVVGERQIRYVPAAAPLSEETGAEARDGTDDDG